MKEFSWLKDLQAMREDGKKWLNLPQKAPSIVIACIYIYNIYNRRKFK